MSYTVKFATKWSDFDPNRHMRHTAYNDYAAEVRIRYFAHAGFPVDEIAADGIGPILFTENTSFRREILAGENISANLKLSGLSEDQSRWKIRHEVIKENGEIAAIIEVYGAWIDLEKRKLTKLPKKYDTLLQDIDKTEDFEMIEIKKK